jgi:hypothetical protein
VSAMRSTVPRHLNKRPLIAGLEPVELLGVAALLISANIIAKMFGLSGVFPGLAALGAFAFLKFIKRGTQKGHVLHVLQFHLKPRLYPLKINRRQG